MVADGKGCAIATSSGMAARRAVRLCQSGDPQEVTVCIWRLFSQQKGTRVARPQQAGSVDLAEVSKTRANSRHPSASCQICINLQVDDKYDFTCQFIRWKYNC
jgi:hypothetical protein